MIVRSRTKELIAYIAANLKGRYDYVSISYGAFDWMLILMRLLGKRCARVWIGTDVLKVKLFWDYRIRAKILALFSDNLTDTPWFVEDLQKHGITAKALSIEHISLPSTRKHEAN